MTAAYKLTGGNAILRTGDGALIPPDPANEDYAHYQAWLAAGNRPTPYEPPAAPPRPDYQGFYDALLTSQAYQAIRAQAMTSQPLTLAAVEFIAAMGDAKANRPNVAAMQACLGNIAAAATDLDATHWVEIGGLLAVHGLADTYQLPN